MDIKFKEGAISIPQVIIDKSSDTLFRNFIALEQVSCGQHSVTSYVRVMGSLIRSPEDVDLLERLGIIIIKSDLETNASVFFKVYAAKFFLETSAFQICAKRLMIIISLCGVGAD